VANPSLVASGGSHDGGTSYSCETSSNKSGPTQSTNRVAPTSQEAKFAHLFAIRENYRAQGLSDPAIDIMMHSWRHSTKAQYAPYINLWVSFAKNRCDSFSPPITAVIDFFTQLHHQGYSYYQICMARSAISNVITWKEPLGKHALVKRFMKGIFEIDPKFPKYKFVWDVSTLLNYFRTLDVPQRLSTALLGKKLAIMLSILAGGHRCQTIHAINTLHISITHDQCNIPLYSVLKQTRPGKHLKPLKFKVYTLDPKLCVVTNLSEYLKKTTHYRTDKALFLSYQKPFKAVTKDTISRWCREMMANAGINTQLFVTHSSRSAAASFARKKGVSLKDICEACGWSRERTFADHYDKEIVADVDISAVVLQ
jgi:hypothetical protein